jgi:tRNA-specific 2-thiouridylase
MRVLAAMSGGVDSAVAAARAVDAGHDVVGVHLTLASRPAVAYDGIPRYGVTEHTRDARRTADTLGIPFHDWDLTERFERDVVEEFVAEYAAGRTPNPCVRCNDRIKFGVLLDKALASGFDAVCTGHYARLIESPTREGPVVRSRRSRSGTSPERDVPAGRYLQGRRSP